MSERRRAVLVMPDAGIEASLQDGELAREDHDIVALLGCGAGWYAALGDSGVLSADEAGELAALEPAGAELIYPLTDAAWRPDPQLRANLDAAMIAADGQARLSVHLGAYALLVGTPSGIDAAAARLPEVRVGERRYPLRRPRSPLQRPLHAGLLERMRERASGTSWQMPRLTLIDGRGIRHTPWSTDPAALRDDALGRRATETDDFAVAARVALREYAPDVIVVAGHDVILGAACGQLIVAEGYRGIHSRRAFNEAQRRRPIVLVMRQRATS